MVNERVCIRVAELNSRWNGVLRIGFSAHDPASLPRPLPKYACPDLTSKPGYWAKALSERCVGLNKLIHYHVSGNGDVHFGIDGEDLGVFFSGVDTRTPLWALIDLYGNCTSIELVDTRKNMNNVNSEGVTDESLGPHRETINGAIVRSQSTGNNISEMPPFGTHSRTSPTLLNVRTLPRNTSQSSHQISMNEPPVLTVELPPAGHRANVNASPTRQQNPSFMPPSYQSISQANTRSNYHELDSQFRMLSTEPVNQNMNPTRQPNSTNQVQLPSGLHSTNPTHVNGMNVNMNGLRFNGGIEFLPMKFHPGCGQHAEIVDSGSNSEEDRKVASRRGEEFSQGYVFSQDTVKPGERIVVKVLATEYSYIGSLAFGLTNCDPSTINLRDLPEDSDLLLDRSEYWVVSKDVANNPDVGDELSFKINLDGSVEFSKNGNMPSAFVSIIKYKRKQFMISYSKS